MVSSFGSFGTILRLKQKSGFGFTEFGFSIVLTLLSKTIFWLTSLNSNFCELNHLLKVYLVIVFNIDINKAAIRLKRLINYQSKLAKPMNTDILQIILGIFWQFQNFYLLSLF